MNRSEFKSRIKLLNKMFDRFGKEVLEIVEEQVKEDMLSHWSKLGNESQSRSIEELIDILWYGYGLEDGFEFSVEKKDKGTQITCTKCTLVDLAENRTEAEWAYRFFCASDSYIVEGFNPNIGFKRTKTLMEGHECCNHFYYYKNEK